MRPGTALIAASALAAGAVVAVSTGMAAGASPSPAAPSPAHRQNFTVVEHADTDTVIDLGAKGDSIGDTLAFGNPIYNAANTKRIGRDQGQCVRTNPGSSYECEWTLLLAHGQIVVQGPFYDTKDSVLAVTGGTGRYRTARGQMVLHARNAAGTAYDFRYRLTF